MTHQNLINNGFGSQYRKQKRAEKREEFLVKVMYVILGLALIYFFYSLDVIINRAIDLM